MKKIRYLAIVLALGTSSCSLVSDFDGYGKALTEDAGDSGFEDGSIGETEFDDSGYADKSIDTGVAKEAGKDGAREKHDSSDDFNVDGEVQDGEVAGSGGFLDSGEAGEGGIGGTGEAGTGGTGGTGGTAGEAGTGGTGGTAGEGGTGVVCTIEAGPTRFTLSTGCDDVMVLDSQTGLIWQQKYRCQINWQSAMDWCDGSDYSGFTNWRLPTIGELEALVNSNRTDPASDFPGMPWEKVWSSTEFTPGADAVYLVNFSTGVRTTSSKNASTYCGLCVRNP